MGENGKGDKRRKRNISRETWDNNYDRIFKHKDKDKNVKSNKVPKK